MSLFTHVLFENKLFTYRTFKESFIAPIAFFDQSKYIKNVLLEFIYYNIYNSNIYYYTYLFYNKNS